MSDFQVEHLADFGSSEPWVARIMLGLGDIIAATPLNGRDDVRDALGEVFYALTDAFNDLRRLRELIPAKAPRSEIDAAFSAFYIHRSLALRVPARQRQARSHPGRTRAIGNRPGEAQSTLASFLQSPDRRRPLPEKRKRPRSTEGCSGPSWAGGRFVESDRIPPRVPVFS
jgi:hypothetical protein